MHRTICVYCSSSRSVAPHFIDLARRFGALLVENGCRLVYGGANIGCMGAVASAAHAAGGEVIGVIPEYLAGKGLDFSEASELIVTPTMAERKARMEELGDAYVILPGGIGTLEELIQVLVLKQLCYHDKPVIIVNYGGFYDPLLEVFQHFVQGKFMHPGSLSLHRVVDTIEEIFPYLAGYQPPERREQWL